MDININVPVGWSATSNPESESFEEVPVLSPEDEKREEWKQWKDSPYQISNMGRVRRVQQNGAFNLRKPRSDDRGKHRVNLTWETQGVSHREEPFIHQAVMYLYGPEKPSGENIVVCHRRPTGEDGKPNNRIDNLYWCDRSKNVEDSWDDGLMDTGARWKQ